MNKALCICYLVWLLIGVLVNGVVALYQKIKCGMSEEVNLYSTASYAAAAIIYLLMLILENAATKG